MRESRTLFDEGAVDEFVTIARRTVTVDDVRVDEVLREILMACLAARGEVV